MANNMSKSDKTLISVAFGFALALTILSGISIVFTICIAWMIPMTVHISSIRKGKSPNTVAFGVCSLIFLGLVPGILLLCAEKTDF